ERIWGKADGIDPAGLPRPCRGVRRTTPPPSAPVVPKLLQRRPNAPSIGQGRADPARRAGRRPDVSRASLGWAAPSIYSSVSFRQGQVRPTAGSPHSSPDQNPQVCVSGWPASGGAGFPAPVAAKASSMPTNDRLGPDNRNCLQDRREPPVQLDEEQAIGIREMNATSYHTPQHGYLTPERGVLRCKPALRAKGRG